MMFQPLLAFVILVEYLLGLVQCQRITLWRSLLTSNTTNWLLYGPTGGTNGTITSNSKCPSGSSCFEYSQRQGLFRYDSTLGYKDIQLSYAIRSKGLTDILNKNGTVISKEYCDLLYIVGKKVAGWTGWNYVNPIEGDRANDAAVTLNFALDGADNDSIVGVIFDAKYVGENDTCWLNNVYLSGIPLHTNHPTKYPSTQPSHHPSFNPSLYSTHRPSVYPTYHPSLSSTFLITDNASVYNSDKTGKVFSNQNIIIALSSVTVFLIIVFLVFCFRSKYKHSHTEVEDPLSNAVIPATDGLSSNGASSLDNIIVVNDEDERMDEPQQVQINIHEHNKAKISTWLENSVKLPQYLDNFMSNGYDSLLLIKDITKRSHLEQIGIELIGHQIRILKQIELLVIKTLEESVETETTLRDDKLYSTPRGDDNDRMDLLRMKLSMAKHDPVIGGTGTFIVNALASNLSEGPSLPLSLDNKSKNIEMKDVQDEKEVFDEMAISVSPHNSYALLPPGNVELMGGEYSYVYESNLSARVYNDVQHTKAQMSVGITVEGPEQLMQERIEEKKNNKVKKHAASKEDGQNPKCTQCGDALTKGIKKIDASFICVTCNALDISDVDRDVDEMFDNIHDIIQRPKEM